MLFNGFKIVLEVEKNIITSDNFLLLSTSFAMSSCDFKLNKISNLEANESKYIKPLRLHYELNNKSLTWDCMRVHDSVAIIVFNKQRQKLIFVRQFRPAVFLSANVENPDKFLVDTFQKSADPSSGYTLELCAGIIDKVEKPPAVIAKEEVLEETGYDIPVESLKFVASYRSGVGVTGSLQYLYFCEVNDGQRVSKGGGIGDEQIEIVELSIDEVRKIMWCQDQDAPSSRPASLLTALSWFMYEYLPTENSN